MRNTKRDTDGGHARARRRRTTPRSVARGAPARVTAVFDLRNTRVLVFVAIIVWAIAVFLGVLVLPPVLGNAR